MDNQLYRVIQPLKDKTNILNQLKEQYDMRIVLTIVIIMENGITPAFQLNPQSHLDFIHDIGAEIDIDLYAYPYQEEPPLTFPN